MYEPDAVLPAFRADLKLTKQPRGGLFDVEDVVAGRKFTLYDFEVSLARLLNGHRTAAEVLEHGLRLGIPVTLETLQKFIRQLDAYGFLSAAASADAPVADGTWQPRGEWDPGMRELYQSGVRLLRSNRPSEAVSYFQAILEQDPQNVQALEMLQLAQESESGGGDARSVSADGTRPPRAHRQAVAVALATALVAAAAFAWQRPGGGLWAAAPTNLAALTPAPRPAGEAVVPLTAAPAASAEAPAAVPPVSAVAAVLRRWNPAVADVRAPRDGRLDWKCADGSTVKKGALLARVVDDRGPNRAQIAAARAKVAELEALVSQDPVYVEFLARAKQKLKLLTRRSGKAVPVRAPAAGVLRRTADGNVAQGAAVASIADGAVWHVAAAFARPPPPSHRRCEVEAPSGERIACRIVSIVPAGEHAEIVASINARSAGWLAGTEELELRLSGVTEPQPSPASAAAGR